MSVAWLFCVYVRAVYSAMSDIDINDAIRVDSTD